MKLRRFPLEMMAAFEEATTIHLEELERQSPHTFGYVHAEWQCFRKHLRDTLALTQFTAGGVGA